VTQGDQRCDNGYSFKLETTKTGSLQCNLLYNRWRRHVPNLGSLVARHSQNLSIVRTDTDLSTH